MPTLLPPGVGRPEIPAVFPINRLLLPGDLELRFVALTAAAGVPVRQGPSLACDRPTEEGEREGLKEDTI